MPLIPGKPATQSSLDDELTTILTAMKIADETLSSLGTVQDDDHLLVSVEANSYYIVEGWIRYVSASTSSDLRINYSYPASAAFARNDFGTATSAAATAAEAVDMTVVTTGDNGRGSGTTERGVSVKGFLQTSTTAGTFRVRWAQVTSSADSLTVKTGSWIKLTKIN
ncbi:hypothetical protein AB0M02_00465 [Actinoplanes sp. NPDC051861]|uniref:hypothetical protein n=1 Tax=Actinoplanes sp. NPDC051861 TaxID=3155170 RepID=UPI00343A6B90